MRLVATVMAALVLLSCQEKPGKTDGSTPTETAQKDETVFEIGERNELLLGDLLFTPAEVHHKVSAETKEVEFVYRAFNQGLDPIKITGLDSGCACIDEKADPLIILAGQSSKITALYSTEKVNGIAEKTLAVKTDQPNVREAFLKVKLEVEPIYVISPPKVSWEIGETNDAKFIDFKVTRDKPIHVLSIEGSRPDIDVQLDEVEKGLHYRIRVKPDSTDSNLLGFIRLETDCELEDRSRPLLFVNVSSLSE